MRIDENRRALVIHSAAITPLYLIGSFFVGALLGDMVFFGLPGHLRDSTKIILAALPTLLSVVVGGALWGRAMARVAGLDSMKRLMWAGALGYGPTVVLVGLALTVLENLIVEQRNGPDLPIHVVFMLLFVPAVFVVAAIGALALGVALKRSMLGGAWLARLALASGLAAGAAFLVVDLLMDALGYRVGAPGAAERATMLTVMLTGNVTASLAGGAVIGLLLGSRRP